jgi:hypothetical protein
MSRPDAPVEKSPLIGLTPLCRPCTDCMSTPSVMSATSSAWVARARLHLQGEAADTGGALEAAAHRVARAAGAGSAGAVAVVHELLQHTAVDEHVAARGEPSPSRSVAV